jgi:hypothetical protein
MALASTCRSRHLCYKVRCKLAEYNKWRGPAGTAKVDYAEELHFALAILSGRGTTHVATLSLKSNINRVYDAEYICLKFLETDIYCLDIQRYFRTCVAWELITCAMNPRRLLRLYEGDYDKVGEYLMSMNV